MVKKVGKYELGRTLGEGTFGKVKYAINTETNEAVAIKVLDKEKIQKQNMGNQIKKEISIMKMVKHNYIVGMIEVLASKTKIFIVLELVTGGELFEKIVSVGKLVEEQALFYFSQLVEGVEYCHKLGVCHRDLKPENLLLDEHGNLKISDFGLSSLYVGDAESTGASRTELLHTTCGTPNYVAPEVIADQGYDGKKADVWSCGVILYVLLAGFLPFDESTIAALFAKIQNADFTYPAWFSTEVRSLLDQVMVADPKTRITLTQLKEHPWMQNKASNGSPPPFTGSKLTIPTDAEVENAVNGLEGGAGDAYDHDGAGDEDDDDDWGMLVGRTARGPRYLNAFDLVSQSGGFMLDRIFNPQMLQTLQSTNELSAASTGEQVLQNGAVRFGNLARRRGAFNFTSPVVPAEELMRQVYAAMQESGFEFLSSAESAMNSGRVRATLRTPKGMVGYSCQVFVLCPTMSLLEIRRGKGDLMEWNNAFNDLTGKKIAHLLNRAPEGEAKSASS